MTTVYYPTDAMSVAALFLAAIWGVCYALFLSKAKFGRWLAHKRTWLTVIIGVAADIAIIALVIDYRALGWVLAVFGLSSIGIIARSIINEAHHDTKLAAVLNDDKTTD